MKDKVSVIIPVYNAQEYIRQCIESIINQSYENIEIILVDDGSPDECPAIIDEYAKKDERIVVIHKENEGVSAARNDGLNSATGKYIQFVDSDDYLEKNMIRNMVKLMEGLNCDMAMCGFYDRNKNHVGQVLPDLENGRCSKEDYLVSVMNDPFSLTYGVLWNKMFKKKLIDKGANFNNDMNFGEDFIFCLNYMKYANSVGIVKKCMYNYVRFNDKSLMFIQTFDRNTATKYIEYMQKRLLIFERYKSFFEEIDLYENYQAKIFEYIMRFGMEEKMQIRLSNMSSADKKECLAFVNNNDYVKNVGRIIPIGRRMKVSARLIPYNTKMIIRKLLIRNK